MTTFLFLVILFYSCHSRQRPASPARSAEAETRRARSDSDARRARLALLGGACNSGFSYCVHSMINAKILSRSIVDEIFIERSSCFISSFGWNQAIFLPSGKIISASNSFSRPSCFCTSKL